VDRVCGRLDEAASNCKHDSLPSGASALASGLPLLFSRRLNLSIAGKTKGFPVLLRLDWRTLAQKEKTLFVERDTP